LKALFLLAKPLRKQLEAIFMGNIFVFNTPDEMVMFDTGFGIYHPDVIKMFQRYGLGDLNKLKRIFITHADADHAGAGGFYNAISFLHRGTLEAIRR